MCRYDKILVNVAAQVIAGQMCVCVCVCGALVRSKHLPRFYHNTLLYCIHNFNNS